LCIARINLLDDSEVNRFSADNEAVIKKQFEKLGYTAKKLDSPTKDSRPDFLISNSSGPQMLCEVKTIVSFGCMPDKGEFRRRLRNGLIQSVQQISPKAVE